MAVSIGPGNGILPSGNMPLFESLLVTIYVPFAIYGVIRKQCVNHISPAIGIHAIVTVD